jgi:hypothetical protein
MDDPLAYETFDLTEIKHVSHAFEASVNDVMLAIRSATAVRPADPDVLTRIGLIGADPDRDLAAARTSFHARSRAARTGARTSL